MTKRLKISDPQFWNQVNSSFLNSGGIYKLIITDEMENPVKIGRLLKPDNQGVLYIGKAICFLDRVIELKKSLSPDHFSQNHECGVRFKNLLNENFNYEHLWVELTQSDEIDQLENELLQIYEREFGEFPPLNRRK